MLHSSGYKTKEGLSFCCCLWSTRVFEWPHKKGKRTSIGQIKAQILKSGAAYNTANDGVPFVTAFHARNLVARKIISRNFQILREDSTTNNIFNKPPLKAFRLAKNLKDLLFRSRLAWNLPDQSPGTFPCNGTVCCTCPISIHHPQLQHPKGMLTSRKHFSCITDNVVHCLSCTKCLSTMYIGRRLADRYIRVLESTAEMSSTGEMTFLYPPTSAKPIIQWRI